MEEKNVSSANSLAILLENVQMRIIPIIFQSIIRITTTIIRISEKIIEKMMHLNRTNAATSKTTILIVIIIMLETQIMIQFGAEGSFVALPLVS